MITNTVKLSKKTIIISIGWIGTILLIGAYTLNSFGFLTSTGPIYAGINILAGVCLGIRVYADRNWSNLILEFFWISIAFANMIRYFYFL